MPLKALTRFPNPDSLSAANTRYEDSARKRQLMGTREQAKRWIKQNYPADTSNNEVLYFPIGWSIGGH
jgi:hypothetical protein